MSAADHYKAGRLQEAIDAQVQAVKTAPADANKRMFLFDLLAFTGTEAEFLAQIRDGGNGMPAFSADAIDDATVRALYDFLQKGAPAPIEIGRAFGASCTSGATRSRPNIASMSVNDCLISR